MSFPANFLPGLEEALHNALNSYNKSDGTASPLHYLYSYQQALQNGAQNPRAITNHLLQRVLTQLRQEQPEYAAILHHRFVEELSAQKVANLFTYAEGTIFKKQREGLEALANLLRQQEWALHNDSLMRCYARLESSLEHQLFGTERQIELLLAQLLRPAAPWLVIIEGIGGIGKTTLADALVRQLLARGEIGYGSLGSVGWVTARQSVLNGGGAIKTIATPALSSEALIDRLLLQLTDLGQEIVGLPIAQKQAILSKRLNAQPHLIVIDNLETVVDVEHLLDTLRILANPSKFLLTSRHSLHFQADLFHWKLNELNMQDTFSLIRHEATIRNLPHFVHARDEDLQAIYATAGGNPLAIKLILGQLHTFALDEVLDDLRHARGQKAEHLYSYVYQRIWERLDDLTQRILLLMPLATEQGADFAFLAQMAAAAGIDHPQLRDGLERLSALNLVESRGDLHKRLFAIHSLTRSFLQQDVLRWGKNVVAG